MGKPKREPDILDAFVAWWNAATPKQRDLWVQGAPERLIAEAGKGES